MTAAKRLACTLLVTVSALALPALAGPPALASTHLRYFGYFAARITPSGGNHLAEVAARSNLNWVQISDVDRYRPEVLDGCRARGCIVSTGNEFFTGCAAAHSPSCNLYPDYRERWLRLARAIGPRIGKVGAFYLLDEPQYRGASPAELATAAQTIRQTFPSVPVMMVEAGPQVTSSLSVPSQVNWVGFDWYCQPFSSIAAKLSILEQRTTAAQRLFLMPEAAPLQACGGKPGHATDAELAPLQYSYYQLAEAHPRVLGLLAFGFWTSGYGSAQLPRVVAAHRQIAARIIPRPAAPARGAHRRVSIRTRRARISRGGRLRVSVRCPRAATAGCVGRLSMRLRPRRKMRTVARARFLIGPGRTRRVRMRVVRRYRRTVLRRARRHRGCRVRVGARTAGAGLSSRRVLVRLPRRR